MKKNSLIFTAAALGLVILNPVTVRAEDTKIRPISIDGKHSLDMALWVKSNPNSAMAGARACATGELPR